MSSSLLAPEFVAELEALRKLLRLRARSGGTGPAAARRRGRGAEFEEHRPYALGDDAGRLDWLAFARTGQPVSKENRADEDTVLRLLLDASRSLDFGAPSKLETASRLAAALAYLALSAGHRAQIGFASGTGVRLHRGHRGRPALGSVLGELAALEPSGKARLAEAIAEVVAVSERPGELVVFSDFLDEGPVVDALGRARHRGHDMTLVHVLAPEEIHPEFEGDLVLVDSETDEALDVTLDPTAIAAYEKRLRGLCDALDGFARRAGARYVRVTTNEPLPSAMKRLLAYRG